MNADCKCELGSDCFHVGLATDSMQKYPVDQSDKTCVIVWTGPGLGYANMSPLWRITLVTITSKWEQQWTRQHFSKHHCQIRKPQMHMWVPPLLQFENVISVSSDALSPEPLKNNRDRKSVV